MTDLALTAAGRLNDAKAPAEARLRQVAKGFEGVFLRELFKGLETQDGQDGLVEDSAASQQYRQLFHGALSEQASGGMGIADIVFKELVGELGLTELGIPGSQPVLAGTQGPPASGPHHNDPEEHHREPTTAVPGGPLG